MVSRLFGKLDAQRQRMLGNDGVCAMACETARPPPAAAAAPRLRNFLRFMLSPLKGVESMAGHACACSRGPCAAAGRGQAATRRAPAPPRPPAGKHYRGAARAPRLCGVHPYNASRQGAEVEPAHVELRPGSIIGV